MKFLILSLPEIITKSLNEEKSASSILFLVSYELEEKKKSWWKILRSFDCSGCG